MFRRLHASSITAFLGGGLAVCLALGTSLLSGAAQASDDQSDDVAYFGRWTVSDDNPVFSAKGKLYKTVDIAPCGNDFCGVSVNDKNQCGPTLFRFYTRHAKNLQLVGHGSWGTTKKKIEIDWYREADGRPHFALGLGDDNLDLTGREGSMPSFQAGYKPAGLASCKAR